MALTAKQERFIAEYLIDLNSSAAAIRAGYSPKSAGKIGFQLLEKTRIQEGIQKAVREREQRTGITADYVLNSLKDVAERCMQAEPVLKREGNEWVETGEYKFDSSGANKALELLGKHLKLFTDKIEEKSDQTITIRLEGEAEEWAQ